MRPNALARIAALDRVVSARAITLLRDQIIASRRRPNVTDAGTYWYALDAAPRSTFEQVIHHLRTLVPRGHEFVGAEWWFRATTTDTGFPFHFDRDEGVRSAIISPDIASILYLGSAGGPTLVLDATPGRASAPKAAIAVHPAPGRFMMFPGTLLHGVLPVAPSRWPRVTMLVNWWRTQPRMEPSTEKLAKSTWRSRSPAPPVPADRRALEPIDPARLMARAAWLEILAEQATTYRR